MPFAFGDEVSNTGDSIGIQCMANKGDLPIDIRWVLNTSPIVSGENGITIIKLNQRTSSLNINYLEGMHRGIYKCLVSNVAGTAEHAAELQVNGLFATLCKSKFEKNCSNNVLSHRSLLILIKHFKKFIIF